MPRRPRWTLPLPLQFLAALVACWLQRQQQAVIDYLRVENQVLREQLAREREGRRPRFDQGQRTRLAVAAKGLTRRALLEVGSMVTPDTLLRWYRELVARKYSATTPRPSGKPRTAVPVAELVCRVARENCRFGYTRIRDTLHHLGHDLARTTVQRILADHGIVPAPERSRRTTWKEFLAGHADVLCAADFFTVEALTWCGLVRFHVLVVMHVATRRVHVAGIARDSTLSSAWMLQVARNLTDEVTGFLRAMRFLVLDRDPLYTKPFRELLAASGVKVVRLPRASPNLSAHVERWIRSIRHELLDRLVIVGEDHLRRVVTAYVTHYNHERPHQGLDGRLVDPDPRASNRSGPVRRVDRVGGLLRFYHRAAA